MLKHLHSSELYRVLSLMAARESEYARESIGRPLSVGFEEAFEKALNPEPLTATELEYQQVIEAMSDKARIELKALILAGRDHSQISYPDEWQDLLQHAAITGGEQDPHKNWLWGRCVDFKNLARGCSQLIGKTN
jgi:hypothetical protein